MTYKKMLWNVADILNPVKVSSRICLNCIPNRIHDGLHQVTLRNLRKCLYFKV